MNIKELFKKVEITNEILKISTNQYQQKEVKVYLNMDYKTIAFDNYKEYLKFLKEEYFEEVVEIMKNVEVIANTWQEIKYIDILGNEEEIKFSFEI